MRALVIREQIGAEGLDVIELDAPRPSSGQVLVRMEAAGLNHVDLLLASGSLGIEPRLPHVLGVEGAGTVEAVGEGVSDDLVGSLVTVYPYVGCGRCSFCFRGEEQVCPVGQTNAIGLPLPGTMRELLTLPARQVVPAPAGLEAAQVAAVTMTGMTAHRMLVHQARPAPGETVLVRAVGSGVGVMCLQLAKAMGATVIGTAGTREKLELARDLGMDAGIDHSSEDVASRVRELTDGRGADVIVDYVGRATWSDDLRALARGGRLVLCGAHTGSKVEMDLWHLFAKEHRIMGSYGGTREDVRRMLDLVAGGEITPVIDRVLPLTEAEKGFRLMEARGHFGKVVLTIA